MPDDWTRAMRRRLARRDQLVRAHARAKHEIRAVLTRGCRAARRSPTCSACAVAGEALRRPDRLRLMTVPGGCQRDHGEHVHRGDRRHTSLRKALEN
jgi:hypothetical protein